MRNHSMGNGDLEEMAADLHRLGRSPADPVNRPRGSESNGRQSSWTRVWATTQKGVSASFRVLLAITILWVALADIFERDVVIIEPFLVGPELQSKGYSDQILAARLAYTLASMVREAKTTKGSRDFSLPLSTRLPDVEVPAVHTSIKSIIRYIQEFPPLRYVGRLLGFSPTRISGLALMEDGDVRITISITKNQKTETQEFKRSLKEMDLLLTGAGQYVLRNIEPYILAHYFYQNKEMNEALSQVQSCIYHDPEHSHLARALWGAILIEEGEYEEAISKLQEAATSVNSKTARDSAIIYSTWGRALLLAGMTEDAIAKFEEAIRIDSDFAPPYSNLGTALWDKKNYQEAIKRFNEAIKRDPDFSFAYYNLAYATAEIEGKPLDAVALYQLTTRIDPRDADAFSNFGELLMNGFDPPRYQEAFEMTTRAIEIDQNHARAWNNLGSYWIGLGDDQKKMADQQTGSACRNEASAKSLAYYQKGRDACQRAVSLYEAQKHHGQDVKACSTGGKAVAYNNLASALEGMREYVSAVNSYSKAIETCPEYWHAYLGKGDALKKQGRFDDALEAYETVLTNTDRIHPKHIAALIRKGRVFLERRPGVALVRRLKDIEVAISSATEVISINQNSKKAADLLDDARKLQSKLGSGHRSR